MAAMEPRSCELGGGGLVLPIGGDAEQSLPNSVRAVLYGVGLLYCFLGVSIVADVFMGAIERITSAKRKKVDKETGQEVEVEVWNGTVANLTLMALGSSAPEILLSVLDTCGKGFYSGELGPSTIVGSAAFNLFVIIAVCIACIPEGEVRRIKQDKVFIITAAFSIFAYAWLLFIVQISSKDVISMWEGVVTFLFFPLLVTISYAADIGMLGSDDEKDSAIEGAGQPQLTLPLGEDCADIGTAASSCTGQLDLEALRFSVSTRLGDTSNRSSFAPSFTGSSAGSNNAFDPQVLGRAARDGSPCTAGQWLERHSQARPHLQGHGSAGAEGGRLSAEASPATPDAVRWLGGTSPGSRPQLPGRSSRRRAAAQLTGSRRSPRDSRGSSDDARGAFASAVHACQLHGSRADAKAPPDCSPSGAEGGLDEAAPYGCKGGQDQLPEGCHEQPARSGDCFDSVAPGASSDEPRREGTRERLPPPPIDTLAKTTDACDNLAKTTEMRVSEGSNSVRPQPEDYDADESWWGQVWEAYYCNGSPEAQMEASLADWSMHFALAPWKLMYALTVPPPSYAGGWPCFFLALAQIGALTAIVGDLAELFGCVAGIEDSVTAITFVALGTSLPDLFASKSAAVGDETADASIVNVTGSNSVNVFLGIGLPWMLSAFYWNGAGATEKWRQTYPDFISAYPDGAFVVLAGDLSFSVVIFTFAAVIALVLLRLRRNRFGGELGGPRGNKFASAILLVLLWLLYIGLSIWKVKNQGASVGQMFAAVLMSAAVLLAIVLVVGVILQFISEFAPAGSRDGEVPASPAGPAQCHDEEDPGAALSPATRLNDFRDRLARFDGVMDDLERLVQRLSQIQLPQDGDANSAGGGSSATQSKPVWIARHTLP